MVWPAFPDDVASRMLALQYQFEQSQWWPVEQLQTVQLQQFAQVFRQAVTRSPYYRRLFAAQAAIGIASWADYRELPVSTRREVQHAGTDLHCDNVPAAHGAVGRTESSGSTGSPLVTLGTAWTQFMWHALLLRDHLWHRRNLRGKLVAIRSTKGETRMANWGPATAAFVTGASVVRGLSMDIDEQLHWLVRENPDYLLAHAVNVHALAARSIELGITLPGLKQARTYGEMLRPDTREVVRAAWEVGLADTYSCEELGHLALQCPECDAYHVQAESVILEVLDNDGRPCVPGETGRVVLSSLHNFAMPLLRYENGDYAEVGEPCCCGRGLPVLRRIVGRQRNMLSRPDGVRHWPSFPSQRWLDIAPIVQIQLVQDALNHVAVKFVMPRDLSADESLRLTAALQECLHYPFRMTFERVDAIPRGAGGKYEDFVSKISG